MKYLSTFSGIGAPEQAIKNLGLPWECVGFSEIDKYAIQTYLKNFPNHQNYGDITKIDTATLPDFDMFVGGFPCQSFSIAGKRRGFEDTRGTLFFEIERILRDKRPRHFVLENVKGLLSHDKGNTFKIVIETLDELGYFVEWQVINSKNHGVPQNRERVFIVGHFGEIPRQKVFPLAQDGEADIVLPTLTARYWGGQANGGYISEKSPQIRQLNNPVHSNDRVYCEIGISPTLNTMQGGNRQPFIRIENMEGKGFCCGNSCKPSFRIRRLTPMEAERLQGFTDNFTAGVSDSQRYKQLGNSITVNVMEAIFKKLSKNQ